MGRGLGWGIPRGPCQPLSSCDSVPRGHGPPPPPPPACPDSLPALGRQQSQGTARACVPVTAHLARFSPTFTPLSPTKTSRPSFPPPPPFYHPPNSYLLGELPVWGPSKQATTSPGCVAMGRRELPGCPQLPPPGCPQEDTGCHGVTDSPRTAMQSAEATSQRRTPILTTQHQLSP